MELNKLVDIYVQQGNLAGAQRVARLSLGRELAEDELVTIAKKRCQNIVEHDPHDNTSSLNDREFLQVVEMLLDENRQKLYLLAIERLIAGGRLFDAYTYAKKLAAQMQPEEVIGKIQRAALDTGDHFTAEHIGESEGIIIPVWRLILCYISENRLWEDGKEDRVKNLFGWGSRKRNIKQVFAFLKKRRCFEMAHRASRFLTREEAQPIFEEILPSFIKTGRLPEDFLVGLGRELTVEEETELMRNDLKGEFCRFSDGYYLREIRKKSKESRVELYRILLLRQLRFGNYETAVRLAIKIPNKKLARRIVYELLLAFLDDVLRRRENFYPAGVIQMCADFLGPVKAQQKAWQYFTKIHALGFKDDEALAMIPILAEDNYHQALDLIILKAVQDKSDYEYEDLIQLLPKEEQEQYRCLLGMRDTSVLEKHPEKFAALVK